MNSNEFVYNRITITEEPDAKGGIYGSQYILEGLFDFRTTDDPKGNREDFEQRMRHTMELVCLNDVHFEYFKQGREEVE